MLIVFTNSKKVNGSIYMGAEITDGKRKWAKCVEFNGNVSVNQAAVRAVTFGLLAITDDFKKEKITLYCANYPKEMLVKNDEGDWYRSPKTYAEDIIKMREVFDEFDVDQINLDNEAKNFISKSAKGLIDDDLINELA